MGRRKLLIISTVVAVFLLRCIPRTTAEEVGDEREFSYESDSEHGPENWGKIHEDWAICNKGQMQSPLDLLDKRVQVHHHVGPLRRTYRAALAVVKNRGHDIMVKWEEDPGAIWINETMYTLKQLHWHAPSEHTLNGRRYAVEMHMVHESADQKVAVVGILYKIGRPDSFLEEVEEEIMKIGDLTGEEEVLGMVNPRHAKWGSRKYYRYLGSLTVPPCTEGVVWTIIKKVRTVSRKQVDRLREAVHDDFEMNARPIQEINERTVSLYRPPNFKC
ncbi:alpha carbonic anhydrase 7-like [Phoenix dactylifera]|uniref:Carbonic anhydrase n=1 Tax=Phoenix dactylifera TaxID=42345 RepID=A0A8B7BK00_PHODC|nr:alpha carbonic anhydrase 7-like [Phoenix dactylifera]